MTFSKFYEIYEADVRHRVKETTWENKETMVKAKIIPFFGERKMIEISAKDVRHWQKEMIEYRDEKRKIIFPVISCNITCTVKRDIQPCCKIL